MEISRRAVLAAGTGLTISAILRIPVALAEPASDRVEKLLARMTLEEKFGQLNMLFDAIRPKPALMAGLFDPATSGRQRDEQMAAVRAGQVGSLIEGTGVVEGRAIQNAALESRLGIPVLFGADVIHGLRTIFPIPLGLAASFEPELAEKSSAVAARELNAVGLHWTFAPMVDVARDQRWGRVAEGSGEDVYLNCVFAAATVRGFQGKSLSAPTSALATPKHFAGYSAVIGGADYNATALSERELRETFLPPFKAAFDAGAITTMSAFVEIDGVPAVANHRLLTDILRTEWDFNGMVVSDWDAVSELPAHGIAANGAASARQAVLAGVDMDMKDQLYIKELPAQVTAGVVPMEAINQAVRRVLRVKEAVGLLDDPFRSLDPKGAASDIRTPAALALARDAARRSVVMLKNEGGLLPLPKSGKRVALIGPFGDDPANMDGCWAFWAEPGDAVTLATGMRKAMRDPSLLTVVKGCGIETDIAGGIAAAVAAAQASDIVVLAVGEMQYMSGEAQSRSLIVVPPAQQRLAEAIAGTGKPVVVVLSNGRALALEGAVRSASAILVGWFLGSEAGNALADILFGDVSPSGRLPVSFPQNSGQVPYFYNHKTTGRPAAGPAAGRGYRDIDNNPLYPFGFGLTYSTVTYSTSSVDRTTMTADSSLVISARVENTGTRTIEEVVQLYIHDQVASVTRPVRELKAFKKVALRAGEAKTVTFTIRRKDLEFVGRDLKRVAEPGLFQAWIAPSCLAGNPVAFMLA